MKIALSLILAAGLLLAGCDASDPLETLYTSDVLPGTRGGDVGARNDPYDAGYFKNIYASFISYNNHTLPEPNGDTTYYLNGDWQWSVPPAGGGGGAETDPVYSGAAASNVTAGLIANWNLAYGGMVNVWNGPLNFGIGGVVSIPAANATSDGYLTSADWNTFAADNVTNNTSTNLTGILTGNGTNVGSVTNTLHAQGTDTTLGTLAADVNFAYYKAITLTCDKGATVPGSPVAGTWFLHTPTGRNVLMMYSGTAWIPIISLGTMTVYVDKTDGTDAIDNGGAVDAAAVKTVQYAVNLIPGQVGGNVIININAETYAEDVSIWGKALTGSYTITISGALTAGDNLVASGAGVKGATTTKASWTDTGLTASAYLHKLFKFTSSSNNGLYRIVDANSTTVVTLCGATLTAQPALNDTATVYDWGTSVNTITLNYGQAGIIINDIKFIDDTDIMVALYGASGVTLARCWFEGDGWAAVGATNNSIVASMDQCVQTGASTIAVSLDSNASAIINGSKFINWAAVGLLGSAHNRIYLRNSIVDGVAAGAKRGCETQFQSLTNFWCPDVYNSITNCFKGLNTIGGGTTCLTANNSYAGNSTNEVATAADYSYND